MSDPRAIYIADTICAILSTPQMRGEILQSKDVQEFLNDLNTPLLQCSYANKKLSFSTSPQTLSSTGGMEVHLVKIGSGQEPITEENMREIINISTLKRGALANLAQLLSTVYVPLLINRGGAQEEGKEGEREVVELDEQVKNLLQNLSSGLTTTIQKQMGIDPTSPNDWKSKLMDLSKIVSLSDELSVWESLASLQSKEKRMTNIKSIAIKIQTYYSQILPEWTALSTEISGLNDLLERTIDSLDGIWRCSEKLFGEERMKHIIGLISLALCARIQKEFRGGDLWGSLFGDVRLKLNECLKICNYWMSKIHELTKTYWTGADKQWKGKPFVEGNIRRLKKRLNEIFLLRSQHDELLRLLSAEEQKELSIELSFDSLRGINAIHYGEYTESTWEKAKKEYEKCIEPTVTKICGHLRREIQVGDATITAPAQMLREFRRWRGLMDIQAVRSELYVERHSLMDSLNGELKRILDEFESRSGQRMEGEGVSGMDRIPDIKNMSPLIASMVWARQLLGKISNSLRLSQGILTDIEEFQIYQKGCQEAIQGIKEYETEQFQKWRSDVDSAMNDTQNPLGFQMSGKLMEIDVKTGMVRVQYSERLVTLLKEVRQLEGLEFKVPTYINDLVRDGKKFYREGVILKQVAHFYNNMTSQIIESQRPMMIAAASHFEKVIESVKLTEGPSGGISRPGGRGGYVTWDNPLELEKYIKKVQEVAEGLMRENRRLRRVHHTLGDYVIELMNTELLRNQGRWKEIMDKVRRIVSTSTKGQKIEETRSWKVHWDHQIYKALEYHYTLGLESLNETLPEINAELVYGHRTVVFKPTIEVLKTKYYKEMKNFIRYPIGFEGVGGDANIFKRMPDKNSHALGIVFERSEELFTKLEKLQKTFVGWVVLGSLDIESFIENNFNSVSDWEENLKLTQRKRKEIERMPDVHKIDCFNISIGPLKKSIEGMLEALKDGLIMTLKSSIKKDKGNVDEFLQKGMSVLTAKPQSVEEISKAKSEAVRIAGEKDDIKDVYKECIIKNKMLRQLAGQNVEISDVESRWANLEMTLSAFNELIEEQKNVVKTEIDSRIIKLNQDIEKFYARWSALKPKERDQIDRNSAKEIALKMKEWREDWSVLEKRITDSIRDSEHFSMPVPRFSYYQEIQTELVQQEEDWKFYETFSTELEEMEKEDWLSFRSKIYIFQDFLGAWAERIKSRERSIVTNYLRGSVEKYKKGYPIYKQIVGDAFEKEHWLILFRLLHINKSTTIESLLFRELVESIDYLLENASDVKELCARAQGEVTLREAINELRVWCETVEFQLTEHVQGDKTTPLIKEWKEIMTQVSDHQSLLINLKESRYFSRFVDQVEQFESKLGGLDDYLQKLNIIQRKWVYLEPIFGRGALPQEQGRFRRVDDEYRSIMLGIGSNPKVLNLCTIPGLKDSLDMILDQLERCQKALNDYLEEKRSKFSRFYFIGDDDLLEILGQGKNVEVIQTHLKKLFAGIHLVEFNADSTGIIAMKSSAKEYVPLPESVRIENEVELWLGDLANQMKATLQDKLRKCLKDEQLDIVNQPSQIVCLAEQIHFTESTYKCIKENQLRAFKAELDKKLELYTTYDYGENQLLLLKLKALILDLIHHIDIIDTLVAKNVSTWQDWEWHRQLKFRLNPQDDMCNIFMCSAVFKYSYEYQGNAPKLVHSPLIDKCYLTLTQGMKLGYGGNPYGPAGTGKTESVKALGRAFGRQVLVFNCDEGIDFQSMGRIFIGLIKCGAWGCFDEFNRLLEEQLSAISQQIQVIQWAIKEKEPTVVLLERTIEVNANAGIFVTMNPAGKGYGGRQKLPDNLKQLFRPVAMSAPDYELIAEVLLFSEGFKCAKQLALKICSLFDLCKQLLSYQQHYDWNLRALKTVLIIGGTLIEKEKKAGKKLRFKEEAVLLIKAIRVNTLSKLTYSDSNKFQGILQDCFPGITIQDIGYEELEKAITEAIGELKLELIEKQVRKMMQFHENLNQRMGVVLVGPSGCGKSTIWNVLKSAYEKLKQPLCTYVMNPKSMPRQQLLGHMDSDTREWTDGVLTASAREVVKEVGNTKSWIVCDGDIDPEWVESLNTVLDDSHLLTLPSGERINFGSNVNFIFETNNLRFASPATVSRMGVLYLSEEDVDVKRLVNTWLRKQDIAKVPKLGTWIEDYFYKGLSWILKREESLVVQTTKVGIVSNVLSHLDGAQTKGSFAIGLIRGFGSNLKLPLRTKFATEFFALMGEKPTDPSKPLDCTYDPRSDSFKSYFFLPTTNPQEGEILDHDRPPIIKTISAQRDMDLVFKWIENMEPVIIVGPEGCGKNLLLTYLFGQLKATQVATIHCNAQTGAIHVIQKLNQICAQSSVSQGRVYRPRECSRLILYLKDINLPHPDKYDTIQLIAFLQQLVTYHGFYDENLEFVHLERIQIIASMNPSTTVGRHVLNSRFTANVRLAYYDYPSDTELKLIFQQFVEWTLKRMPGLGSGNLGNAPKKIGEFVVDTYKDVRKKFSIDEFRHYLFTPRDLTQWIFGLLRYDVPNEDDLKDILLYEGKRIFRDKLVGKETRLRFDNLLYSWAKKYQVFKEISKEETSFYLTSKDKSNIRNSIPGLERIPYQDFKTFTQQLMTSYEREENEIGLYLFEEVLETISQEDRVLSRPGGAILLAGVSGVGRRTLTQVVAYLRGLDFYSPKITRDYSLKEFKRDLKALISDLVIENKQALLFLEDHQLVEESFLQYINSLICSSEIPGLYTPEELEPILASLQDEMKSQYEHRHIFDYFRSKIKKNLRIVLSLDNTHHKFLSHCSSNPALYAKCAVLWKDHWSKESMHTLAKLELQDSIEKDKLKNIAGLTFIVHNTCLKIGATPLKYMDLLRNYKNIYQSKLSNQGGQSERLNSGLEKLKEAEKMVEVLLKTVQENKIELTAKQEEAKRAMEDIALAMQKASERKIKVEKLRTKQSGENTTIEARRNEIQNDLSEILPLVEKAQAAVGKLSAADLQEIKSYKLPPDTIHDILSCVMVMMGVYDTTWTSMKRFLGQIGVVKSIVNYDARRISPQHREEVLHKMQENPNSFVHDKVMHVSHAAAPLADWVAANIKFSYALDKIKPLEESLAKQEAKLHISQQKLQQCEEELSALDKQVVKLQGIYEECMEKAAKLKESLRQAEEKLNSARGLIGKLSGEKKRWFRELEKIQDEVKLIPTGTLLAAGFLTYLGGENEAKRAEITEEWNRTMKLFDLQFMNFMCGESELLKWKTEGLPADSLSMENAIMILNSLKTPLIIDPATSATEWLKFHLKEAGTKGLDILNQQDNKFNTQLELAVRFGKTLIIQEVDSIEPMLFPILRKDLVHQGPRWVVQIGDKLIDYNEGFQLFMATRDSYIEIPPNAISLISVINFTVTKSGLEGQLLSITLNHEKPELEQQKTELLEKEERLKIQLADLEDKLLTELVSSGSENILENKSLIDSLNETKEKSKTIEDALEQSSLLQKSLDEQREAYRILASKGSTLFMIISDLQKVNNMYLFSLSSFIKLFKKALGLKPSEASMSEKLQNLSHTLIVLTFFSIGRSLLKSDRLMFGLHFIKGIHPEMFKENEWEFFIGTVVSGTDTSAPFPKWANSDRKDSFYMFANTFPRLIQQLTLDNNNFWASWATILQAEKEFHSQVKSKISPFQRLILLQVFRPDRLESGMNLFVCEGLGKKGISPPPLSLQRLYKEETNHLEPILFITGSGSDPSKELQEFAEKEVGRARYHELAMGGGQNEAALKLLRDAAKEGDWLCLKNLHLVTSWLPMLEKELKSLEIHNDFRLWLTTQSHPKFPSILLQSSMKITYEAPPGIKKNLQRTFQSLPENLAGAESSLLKLELMLGWFHAIIQERRTYIPQGWIKFYEFSYGDLRCAEGILREIVEQSKKAKGAGAGKIEWRTVYGLLENAVYGGRVDNDYDMKVLKTYLRLFFSKETFNGEKSLSEIIHVPKNPQMKDLMTIMSGLPDQDTPSIFGLPSNIDSSVQRFNSMKVIYSLKQLQAISAEDLKFNREKWGQLLGPLWKLWQTLIKIDNFRKVKIKAKQLSAPDPVEGFVYMEFYNMQILMEKIHESLEGIAGVIYSSGLLTSLIEKEATLLLKSIVPERWIILWEGPETPTNYLRAFARKANALIRWVSRLENNQFFTQPFVLSEIFHPETFLNAFRQRIARELRTPIDELKLVSTFEEGYLQGKSVIQIKDLLLQGAAFGGGRIIEQKDENTLELFPLPPANLSYITMKEEAPYSAKNTVQIPVYHTLTREILLCELSIPHVGDANDKIIGGVAIILDGSD